MKTLSAELLRGQEITWCHPGESVGVMQGMALNKLNQLYPTKKPARCGYFLYSPGINSDPLGLAEACYYLIERKVTPDAGGPARPCLVAFREDGDAIAGAAIFEGSDCLEEYEIVEVPGGAFYVSQVGNIYTREGALVASCGTVEAARKHIEEKLTVWQGVRT